MLTRASTTVPSGIPTKYNSRVAPPAGLNFRALTIDFGSQIGEETSLDFGPALLALRHTNIPESKSRIFIATDTNHRLRVKENNSLV